MSKQVFLYLSSAKLSHDDLFALREAGFVPIRVNSFNSVKIIDPLLEADRSAVWMAAMEAISKHQKDGEGPKTMFGRLLAEKLADTSLPKVAP